MRIRTFILPVVAAFVLLPRMSFCDGEGLCCGVEQRIERVRTTGVERGELKALEHEDGTLRVSFVLAPTTSSYIRCELALPDAERWDGRLWGHGNGGFGGRVLCLRGMDVDDSAHVQCDMGTSRNLRNGSRPSDPEVFRDYMERATHLMTVAAKRLVRAYYGREPDHCYFRGASTGGGQGISEALLHPKDYDGILSGVPSLSHVPRTAIAWNCERLKRKYGSWFDASEQRAVREGELAYFARTDPPWARGRFIVDPRSTPERIDGCWREIVARNPQLAGREALWRELMKPVVVRGRILAPAPLIGSEFGVGWGGIYDLVMGKGSPQDVTEDELLAFADRADARRDNPDLSDFKARGGKIIMYAGCEDVSCLASVITAYYDEVLRTMGGPSAVGSFFAYYVEPGRTHAAFGAPSGPGQLGNPPLAAEKLMAWVERGEHPGDLAFSWRAAGRQLVVSPYPDCRVACVLAPLDEQIDRALTEVGKSPLLPSDDIRLDNGLLSLGGRTEDVSSVCGLRAPPYFCEDFALSLRFNGRCVPADDHVSRPESFARTGTADGWRIETRLLPVAGERAAILEVSVTNENKVPSDLSLQRVVRGTNSTARVAVRWSLGSDDTHAFHALLPGRSKRFYVACAIGKPRTADYLTQACIEDPDGVVARSIDAWRIRLRKIVSGW